MTIIEGEEIAKDILAHYGVKGMKWGVRRGRKVTARFGGKKTAEFRPASPDHAQAARLAKKKVHELSNDDIRALKTRLSLERDLKSVSPSTIDRGTREAERVLKIAGLGTRAWNVAKHPATQATVAAGAALITKTGAAKAVGSVLTRGQMG